MTPALSRLLLFVAVLLAAPVGAVGKAQLGDAWLHLGSDQLMQMGVADARNGGRSDTALVCFTIVSNRYDRSSMSRSAKQQCAEANMSMWSVYFYEYYDYPKCFECLSRAREIADEAGLHMPNIYLGFGCMYQTISEETNNSELGLKALEYYRQSLETALAIGDDEHVDMACTNVLSVSSLHNGMKSMEREWQQYRVLPDTNRTKLLRRYNKLLYQAYTHLEHQRYDEAIGVFDQQIRMVEGSQYARLLYFTCIEKAKILAKKGDFTAAMATLRQPEQIATRLDMKDCKLETYGLLSDYALQTGDRQQYEDYRERCFLLKDTLTNYHQLASVNAMEFQQELKRMDEQMTEIKHHREVMTVVIAVVIGFALVVLAFLFVVFRQNSRLKKSNRSLYQTNVAMLRAEEEERRMRKKYEQQLSQSAEEAKNTDSIEETKYKNSTLTDDDKQQLLDRIKDVMDNHAEVFSPEFSVERLAQLCGSKYKYVSQVIHEAYDCNFNTFVNDYRIKEACKRMGDVEHFGRLTIEAISNSVGFKSRSSFATSFKRVTGLTPSEYQRLALEEGVG